MDRNGAALKIGENGLRAKEVFDESNTYATYCSPLRQDAFDLTNKEKIEIISEYFKEIMKTMGLDMEDDSLKGTPGRVAKMFISEIFSEQHDYGMLRW